MGNFVASASDYPWKTTRVIIHYKGEEKDMSFSAGDDDKVSMPYSRFLGYIRIRCHLDHSAAVWIFYGDQPDSEEHALNDSKWPTFLERLNIGQDVHIRVFTSSKMDR